MFILHLTVPPESVDVNVHPQKREIKFEDEQSIFRLVYHAVLGTLTSQHAPEHIAAAMVHASGKEALPEETVQTVQKTLPTEDPAPVRRWESRLPPMRKTAASAG